MASIYIFNSETELIDELRSEKTMHAVQNFFEEKLSSISEVIKLGVAGNTFRAFRKLPEKPSVVFREWTDAFLNRSLLSFLGLESERSKDDYQFLVHSATINLCEHWGTLMRSELGYGRGAKLLNLVFKKLACLKEFDQKQIENLIRLQHVPLDSYTILGLRKIAPELHISPNATMAFIQTL